MKGWEFQEDRAYQQRLNDVLMKAILLGMQDDQGRVILRTADVAVVLADLQAMMLGITPTLSVPSHLRQTCDRLGARLLKRSREMQQHVAQHGSPFETVVIDGAVN